MSDSDRPDDPAPPDAEPLRDPPIARADLDHGLRFTHLMAMQGRMATERVEAMLSALISTLEQSGQVSQRAIEEHLPAAQASARARAREESYVAVAPTVDKYAITDLPDIDCQTLLPICKGRCCRLLFPLSFQDLDEGVIKWNYARPYVIRQRPEDSYCTHNQSGACTVYQERPAVCRVYDCRADTRIWIDFENRIPAPPDAVRDQPVLIERIGIGKPARP